MHRTLTAPNSVQAAKVRVMLADDHHVTLWGLQQLLQSADPAMTVSGQATTAGELMDHPALDETDVVLLDLGLSQRNSLDCMRQLVHNKGVKVVVLTGSTDPANHRAAVRHGASGVVLKNQPAQDILDAIRTVHGGSVWLDATLLSEPLQSSAADADSPGMPPEAAQRRIATLTPKEREVVRAVVRCRGGKALVAAEALTMSEHTLRNHLTTIYSKLGVHGKLNLYLFAVEHGLATDTGQGADPRH